VHLVAAKGKENRTQEVSAISRGLKRIAKDLEVPLVALSQLSRKPEDRKGDHKPILSDTRDSGSIEQDADVVLLLYRPGMYFPDRQDMEGVAEVIIGKNRNGPTATTNLVWIDKFMKFENRAEDP